MSTDPPETAASVTIVAAAIAPCVAPSTDAEISDACFHANADAGGRPMSHQVLCHTHARVWVARRQTAGLKA